MHNPESEKRNGVLTRTLQTILAQPGPVRIVAIDGPGGAGKTTIAAQLSDLASNAPVIHTDDFASADNPINWWPRLKTQVIDPLVNGQPARYQRYDWPSQGLAEWHTVALAPVIIIEGVSSGRSEWAHHLTYLIWVETPADERLRRGLERDGLDALSDWQTWMAAEDQHYANDPTKQRADLIIDGATSTYRSSD